MLPLLPSQTRFPNPDWKAIIEELQLRGLPVDEEMAAYAAKGFAWLTLIRSELGDDYRVYESPNFWLLSAAEDRACRALVRWAEHCLREIRSFIGDACLELAAGVRIPIVETHDQATYYEYAATYAQDGDYGFSGGCFISRGYGHIVYWQQYPRDAEATIAHELTHAMVCHLPLPFWLNEGIAQLCQISITGTDSTPRDEILDTLSTYWTTDTIQDFWSGRGFYRQDAGQRQSYHLAQVLTRKLVRPRNAFQALLREVDFRDAGAAAVKEHYGVTLQSLVADYLGPGDWTVHSVRFPEGEAGAFSVALPT